MLVIILINEIHTEAWRLIWLLSFFTLCFSNKKNTMAGNDFIFIFFRTHFTAAWVFLLLRMQNGEKIKDFIFHFNFLTVKVSQMGRISVKFSGCDYLQFFKVVLSLYTCVLMVKKKVPFVDSFEKPKFISDEVWNDDEFVKKQGENGFGGGDVSESRGRQRVEDCRNKDILSWLFLNH